MITGHTVLGVTLVVLLALFILPDLRRNLITVFLFRWFKKVIPVMSPTEQEAIAAGEVWWEGDLFQGRPDWNKLLHLKKPTLSSAEQHFLDNQVNDLCRLLDDWSIQVNKDLPLEVWQYLKKEGFFGLMIPKEYGGLGFSALGNSTIVLKIASRSLTAAITVMVPNSLGPGELLLAYGSNDQKNQYLPKLACGEEIPCFALTSPEAGSDANAIIDKGIVCKGEFQGKEILGMKLTWDKRYITLAPVATVLGLTIKLYDPEKLLGDKTDLGITLCLIPTNQPGVEIGKRHAPLHQAFMNGPTRGQEVFVPLDWIIGGVAMAGKGWKMLVECLAAGRGISLPALSTAGARVSFATTPLYTQIRQQFHRSLAQFEGVEEVLARIAGNTYIAEATRLFTLNGIDSLSKGPAVASAITKYHLTEMGSKIAKDTMDIFAGKGIMLGPKNINAPWYDSVPISLTVEGANILTRNLIIFGQGVIRCHPFIQKEIEALNETDYTKGLKAFDKIFFKHMAFFIMNFIRVVIHSLTGALFCPVPKLSKNIEKPYYRQLGRMSVMLACITDLTLLAVGGRIKYRERLSARLGDILSYLYMASAILKYYHDSGTKKSDVPFLRWGLETCLYRIQENMILLCTNFPSRILGFLVKILFFPWGQTLKPPGDLLDKELATFMIEPSARERFMQNIYIGDKQSDPVFYFDYAFNLLLKARPLFKKSTLTKAEMNILVEYEKARQAIIAVDEFHSDHFKEGVVS